MANARNQRIVDLRNAVNLKNGEVEFSSDFVAVRPKDVHLGNGSMLLEVPNRGNARILALVDGGDEDLAHDAGDAWLLRNGYTIVSLGWQWDAQAPGQLRFFAPIAKENGKTITGLLRGDLMLSAATPEIPLGHLMEGHLGGVEYPVAAPEDPRNVLTVRDSREGQRTVIPRTEWQFAHTVDGKLVPSDRFIHLQGGFQPGKIYEYVYVVANPVVAGGGFAAIRDFASYAKHDPNAITPAQRVYGEGISQNGRFLRDFLYQGFNADEEGRIALDGVLAHVAGAGRGSFNYRFAQPSRDAQPTSSVFFPTDIFPFTDQPEEDSMTGETAGLLDRAAADKVVPRIFFSNTAYEYWGRAAALIHVSADGKQDAHISDRVRIYHFAGLQHFSVPFPPEKGTGDVHGQHPQSPLPVRYFWRAMIANMDAWVRSDTPPPPSSYPKIADHNLVPLSEYAFPRIPGVNLPHEANQAYRLDFGPNWQQGILSIQPPKVGPAFPAACAPGRRRRERARRRTSAARSPCRLRPTPVGIFVIHRLVRPINGSPLRPRICPFPRRLQIGRRRAIRASRSRNATRAEKTISPDIRRPSTAWCSNDGFCPKTAQPCCIAASRSGSRVCNELPPKRIQMTSRNISRRELLRGSMAVAALASAPRLVQAASGQRTLAYVGTYSTPVDGGGNGKGIYLFEMNPATGELTPD